MVESAEATEKEEHDSRLAYMPSRPLFHAIKFISDRIKTCYSKILFNFASRRFMILQSAGAGSLGQLATSVDKCLQPSFSHIETKPSPVQHSLHHP